MKKIIAYTMTALLATVVVSMAAPNKEAVIAKEKEAWQAFKDKKPDEFKKLISAHLMAVYSDGMNDLQKELDTMAKTEMKSFDLTDFNVVFPDPATAIITYKATVEATQEGKDVGGTYNAGSVWRLVNGKWWGIFHAEAKVEPAEKPAS
jgi:hypothetical protein